MDNDVVEERKDQPPYGMQPQQGDWDSLAAMMPGLAREESKLPEANGTEENPVETCLGVVMLKTADERYYPYTLTLAANELIVSNKSKTPGLQPMHY